MVAVTSITALSDELVRMASRLEALNLGIDHALDAQRDRLVARIRNYLLPRISSSDGPLTIVFAGPTGSGKSTLVNTLSGMEISRTGPIRPTTKAPVVLTSAGNAEAFARLGPVDCEVLTGSAPVLDELALVDTPDIDSTATEHRAVAEQLIDTADVVVFVTSALRYADLVPWQVLRRAHSRGAPVLFVLNRTTADAAGALIDFQRRLTEAGLVPDVIKVPEHHLTPGSQLIPALAVLELRRRLHAYARGRRQGRAEITESVLAATMVEVSELMDAVDDGLAEMDLTAKRIRTPFTGRAHTLDLTGVAPELTLAPVPTWAPWRRRLWLRRNRRKPDEAAAWRALAVAAIKARVEGELIRLACDVDPRLTSIVPAAYRTVLDNAVDAWIERAAALVDDLQDKDRPLASMVLVSTVVGDIGEDVLRDLVGLDGGFLIDTMRAELKDRLDVVYGFVGDLAAASQTTNA